jgi:S-DNA-T family DNA segregation ATPase FtsK/SpoIIIE
VLKDKRYKEICGILIFLVGIILFLSIFSYVNTDYSAVLLNRSVANLIGPAGALFAHIFRSAFGIASYIFTIMIFISGRVVFKHGEISSIRDKLLAMLFLIIGLSAFLAIGTNVYQNGGGFIGYYIWHFFKSATGTVGAYLIIIFMNIAAFILLGIVSLTTILESKKLSGGSEKLKSLFRWVSIKNYEDQIPLNTIGEEPSKNKKMPWIIRKKIIIGKRDNETETDSVKYLGMNISAAASESFFAKEVDEPAVYENNSEVNINYNNRMLKEDEFGIKDEFSLNEGFGLSNEDNPIVTEEYYENGDFENCKDAAVSEED